MEFFEIKKSIRKVGHDKYIIGTNPLDPLLTIDRNGLTVDTINTNNIYINNVDIHEQISGISEELVQIQNSGQVDRYNLQEAFEVDEFGDIVPSNAKEISDTAWILRNENDLELRANVWRYNIGEEIYTEDISF